MDIAEATADVSTDNIAIEQDLDPDSNTEMMFNKLNLMGHYLDIDKGIIYVKVLRDEYKWRQICKFFTPTKPDKVQSYQMVIVATDMDNQMFPQNWYIASNYMPMFIQQCLREYR